MLSGLPADEEAEVSVGFLCDEDCTFVDDEVLTEASLLIPLVLLEEDELVELLLLDDELEEVVSRAVDDELLLLDEDDVEELLVLLEVVVIGSTTYSSWMDVIAMPLLPQAPAAVYWLGS